MANLVLKNLNKSYGEKKVLDNISFEVRDREFCILLGSSGCGKSTILRLIAGLDAQDGGVILIGNKEVSHLTPKERNIAMVFQSYALYPHMNVIENMSFSLKMRKMPGQEIDRKVMDAARMLDIADLLNHKPKELSGGQRQRVAIGRAIVRDPELFLFDEPLSNLDAKLRSAMRIELAGIHKKLEKTIIYVTHDQIEALTLGEKVVLIDQGKIQQIGTPDDVYNRPANLFVAGFIGNPQMNFIDGRIEKFEGRLCFRTHDLTLDVSKRELPDRFTDQYLSLGIRPESLIPGQGPISVTIDFVEPLGSETILHTRTLEHRLIARVASDVSIRPGENIMFSMKEKGIHFFHEGRNVLL